MTTPTPITRRLRWLKLSTGVVTFACLFATAVGMISAGKTLFSLIPIAGLVPLIALTAFCLASSRHKEAPVDKDNKYPANCGDGIACPLDHPERHGDGSFPAEKRLSAAEMAVAEGPVRVLKPYASTDSFSPGQCSPYPPMLPGMSSYFSCSSLSDGSEQVSIDPDYYRLVDRTDHKPSHPFEDVRTLASSTSSHCGMCGAFKQGESSTDEGPVEIILTPSATSLEEEESSPQREPPEEPEASAVPEEVTAVPTVLSEDCFVNEGELEEVPL